MTAPALPLAGIRVLEFCHTIMGPTAGVILGRPRRGCDQGGACPRQAIKPAACQGFASGFFVSFNRNKRGIRSGPEERGGPRGRLHKLISP